MMGRHRKPSSRIPQRTAVAVVVTASGLSVSTTGAFAAVSPADTVATVPIPVVPSQPPAAPTEVTVQPGTTLSRIATENGQTWQDLWGRNLPTVSNPDMIHPGQVLSLVAPIAPLPAPVRTSAPAPAPAATAPAERVAAPVAAGAAGLVGIAETFIGVPYRWGGKSRSGLDCSGLVYLVLKQAGLTDTYRTSLSLRSWAKSIPRSQARAGDLVFGPGHVAIYAGNGMMIDAPKPGGKVSLRPVYSQMTEYGRIPT